MRNSRRTVLVAGGAGFLGSHLCERLIDAGDEVVCLDNFQTGARANLRRLERADGFTLVEHDIVEPLPPAVTRRRFARVYNLACAASPPLYQADPEHTLLTSVLGAHRLLKLSQACGARFLLASTSEVYGDPDVHPQTETYRGNVSCTGPRACYDEGKRAAETLAFDYDRLGRVEVRVARIFNTYGPRLSAQDGRVVSNIVSQALAGDDITIFGEGVQTRSFCYVADTVEGLIRLMEYEGEQPGPINIGNPVERSILELAELVLALTGSNSELTFTPLPVDDPRRRKPNIEKAERLLGWTPKTTLVQGLRQTIAWFEQGERREAEPDRIRLTA
jgi:UDP-glucuronate decarboxylase